MNTDAEETAHDIEPVEPEQTEPPVEWWARRAYYPGRSAGAAMRDLISDIGSNGRYPRLHALLNDLMDDFNRRGNDNAQTVDLLRDIVKAIPKH
jgi:hypothetical protein